MRIVPCCCGLFVLFVAVACSSTTTAGLIQGDGNPAIGPDGGAVRPGGDGGGALPGPDGGIFPVGDGAGPAVAPAKACADFADALCTKLQQCSSFALSVTYGDAATCRSRTILSCIASFGGQGTSATPAKVALCAQGVGAVSCDDFLALKLGPACDPGPGALANGAACADNAQCSSSFCSLSSTAACGKCGPKTTAGDTAVRGKIGDACSVQADCDLANAVGCNTTSGKCITLTIAPSGGACGASGFVNVTSFAVCPSAGTCWPLVNGKCTAAAADGAPCSSADSDPHCMAPARCVGGKCVVPDPATCR